MEKPRHTSARSAYNCFLKLNPRRVYRVTATDAKHLSAVFHAIHDILGMLARVGCGKYLHMYVVVVVATTGSGPTSTEQVLVPLALDTVSVYVVFPVLGIITE